MLLFFFILFLVLNYFLSFSLYLHELKCSQNAEKIFFFYDHARQILQYTLYIYYYNATFFSFLINHFISLKEMHLHFFFYDICLLFEYKSKKKYKKIFYLFPTTSSYFFLFLKTCDDK